ncbi:hypothetical protein DFS34DRAFT_648303 [Phlyctochytrium arcticum]|nr:hypothetical protein DFS34DRAFT_648303 [Phlyctochytrium arcticum]
MKDESEKAQSSTELPDQKMTLYTTLVVLITSFFVATNLFPQQVERLGLAHDWIRPPRLQRSRRAPIPLLRSTLVDIPRTGGDAKCPRPALGRMVSAWHLVGGDIVLGPGSTVTGRVCSLGGVEVTEASIGRGTFPQPVGCALLVDMRMPVYAVISRRDVSITNSEILNGHVALDSGDPQLANVDSTTKSQLLSRGCNIIFGGPHGSIYDFSRLRKDLEGLIEELADLPPTTRATYYRLAPPKLIVALPDPTDDSGGRKSDDQKLWSWASPSTFFHNLRGKFGSSPSSVGDNAPLSSGPSTHIVHLDGWIISTIKIFGLTIGTRGSQPTTATGQPAHMDLDPGATLIINIDSPNSGETVVLDNVDTTMLTFPHKVIWNFYGAAKVRIVGSEIFGTVVAKGDVEIESSRVLGGVYALGKVALSGEGSKINGPLFDGCAPVKLPSSVIVEKTSS